MKIWKVQWCLWLVAPMAAAVQPESPLFLESGLRLDSFVFKDGGGLAALDVDGDGAEELVFRARAHDELLVVVGRLPDGQLGIKQALIVPRDGEYAQVLAAPSAGEPVIYTIGTTGEVREYGTWPLRERRVLALGKFVKAAAIGDVDGDGSEELVVVTVDHVCVHSLADGREMRSLPITGATSLALAQLDADAALEIVLSDLEGSVVDGATMAVDWRQGSTFGPLIAAGRVLADGGSGWFGAPLGTTFTIFGSSPWGGVWNSSYDGETINAVTVLRSGPSQADTLVVGNSGGELVLYDAAMQSEQARGRMWSFGFRALVEADIDGNRAPEVAALSKEHTMVAVASGREGSKLASFVAASDSRTATLLDDVDGDGRVDLAVVGPNVAGFDAQTGLPAWVIPDTSSGEPIGSVRAIAAIDRAEEGYSDLLLGGEFGWHARLTVVDGRSKAIKQQIDGSVLGMRAVAEMVVADIDGDGIEDYLVAAQPVILMVQGLKVAAFSGRDGTVLWMADVGGMSVQDLLWLDDLQAPSGRSIVVVSGDGLRAFDGASGSALWTLSRPTHGAVLVPNGEKGSEIAVFFYDTIDFLDSATHVSLRQYTLPSFLRAVRPLDAGLDALLIGTEQGLLLLDGLTGSILGESRYLGPALAHAASLSARRLSDQVWLIAAATGNGVYRYRLALTGTVFANGFE